MTVNPEAIGVFGLIATVMCFGLEQLGVGITKNTDMAKVQRTLAYVALVFGCCTQLLTAFWMFLFSVGGEHSKYLGTVFSFFGLFWLLVAFFFFKGGDKKVMAHFFACGLFLVILFTIRAFQENLIWPLGIDLAVIDVLLFTLVLGWYTGSPIITKASGVCNIAVGVVSAFLLFPHVLAS